MKTTKVVLTCYSKENGKLCLFYLMKARCLKKLVYKHIVLAKLQCSSTVTIALTCLVNCADLLRWSEMLMALPELILDKRLLSTDGRLSLTNNVGFVPLPFNSLITWECEAFLKIQPIELAIYILTIYYIPNIEPIDFQDMVSFSKPRPCCITFVINSLNKHWRAPT